MNTLIETDLTSIRNFFVGVYEIELSKQNGHGQPCRHFRDERSAVEFIDGLVDGVDLTQTIADQFKGVVTNYMDIYCKNDFYRAKLLSTLYDHKPVNPLVIDRQLLEETRTLCKNAQRVIGLCVPIDTNNPVQLYDYLFLGILLLDSLKENVVTNPFYLS